MKKSFWGFLITAACILFGIMLPSAIFSFQDKKVISSYETYATDEIQINNVSTVFDVMKNINDSMYEVDCTENMARLSSEEAKKIAFEFINHLDLTAWGIERGSWNEGTVVSAVTSIAIMRDEPSDDKTEVVDTNSQAAGSYDGDMMEHFASVIWRINIECNDKKMIALAVDDKNKKVISFLINSVSSDDIYYVNKTNREYMREILFPYLEKYYDVSCDAMYVEGGMYSLMLRDKEEHIIVHVHMSKSGFSFNVE